jgi:hypothetical protein
MLLLAGLPMWWFLREAVDTVLLWAGDISSSGHGRCDRLMVRCKRVLGIEIGCNNCAVCVVLVAPIGVKSYAGVLSLVSGVKVVCTYV